MLSDVLPITKNCMAPDGNGRKLPATQCFKMTGKSGNGQQESFFTKNLQ